MSAVIMTENLTRRFGDFVAVDHLNFSIEPGEVVGWLGPNGCGKTTTIRMLLGLLLPSGGRAEVLGYDPVRQAEALRARVGYMSQRFVLYTDLTVRENLVFYAGMYGIQKQNQVWDVLEQTGLADAAETRTSDLPVGWRQRLSLAVAIVHRPSLLFLDEPTSGVDPVARRAFWDLIYARAAGGVTVMVTTHYMDEAEYCQRVGIMRAGRLLAVDTPAGLKQNLAGQVWEVFTAPLIPALETLQAVPGVLRTGLNSDALRVVAQPHVTREQLAAALVDAGLAVERLERAAPTLEDVFLAFA